MRVFVTGATGFVGSAVVQELLSAGHQVLGLSRSEAGAAGLRAAGAEVLQGSLQDLDSLRRGAEQAEAVAHLAFNHDFSRFAENCEDDARAIKAMGAVLEGSAKPMLVTSGLALQRSGDLATEQDLPAPHFPRQSEEAAAEMAARGVRISAVRLSPTTHGRGDHGFTPTLIRIAREKGAAAYIGEGRNRWAAVHRTDAARLYRLALEQGVDGGPFHAVAEEGIPFKDIAAAIGRGLGVPVVSVSAEEAEAHFGWFARFAGFDVPASAARTRARLGWAPKGLGLLEDMERSGYFEG